MSIIYGFSGKILCNAPLLLGEGPTYDPTTDTAWWFNILGKELHELQIGSGTKKVHALPAMASVLCRIDAGRQLIVSEFGLNVRDIKTGAMELVTPVEADRPEMRSNDGRTHPSGALWFGTMSKAAEGRKGAGSIYHVAAGKVTVLYTSISIPNAICFSPDGTLGYFVDTMVNRLMRVALDPQTGLPVAEPQLFSDESNEPGGVDGAVCDAEGNLWNARWGMGEIHCYTPQGKKVARYKLPANQSSCPAFFGALANRMLVTTAREGLNADDLKKDPQAGFTFELGPTVKGKFDPPYKID